MTPVDLLRTLLEKRAQLDERLGQLRLKRGPVQPGACLSLASARAAARDVTSLVPGEYGHLRACSLCAGLVEEFRNPKPLPEPARKPAAARATTWGRSWAHAGGWWSGFFLRPLVPVTAAAVALVLAGTSALYAHRAADRASGRVEMPAEPTDHFVSKALPAAKLTAAFQPARRWAVVIGVAEHRFRGAVDDIPHPAEDARNLARYLTRDLGYLPDHVALLVNQDATLPNIRYALGGLLGPAGKDDLVLVYFSGHSYRAEGGGESYLITYDANPLDLKGTALSLRELTGLLAHVPPARRLLILDACRSGSDDSTDRTSALAGTDRNLAVLTSSRADEDSYDSDRSQGGVFTTCLINGMTGEADTNGDGQVTLDEAFAYVSRATRTRTANRQNPTLSASAEWQQVPISLVGGFMATEHDSRPLPGSVRILTDRVGAVVALDGDTLGAIASVDGGMSLVYLRPGDHHLTVVDPILGHAWEASIKIRPGMNPDIFAGLQIASTTAATQPAPARVYVYDESDSPTSRLWRSSGWMPDGNAIYVVPDCATSPQSGSTCTEIGYSGQSSWAGLMWLASGSWGDEPGVDVARALGLRPGESAQMTFWARGAGAVCQFKVGGVNRGRYRDSINFPIATPMIHLTSQWERLTLQIPPSTDLSNVVDGLCVVFTRADNPQGCRIWVDSAYFEKLTVQKGD